MKRKIFFSALSLSIVCNFVNANVLNDDSTKIIDSGNKRIIVTENINKQRVEVEVYELQDGNEIGPPYEKIFEGHYRDGVVHEQRKSLLTIDIPSPLPSSRKRVYRCDFKPHYSGFGMGFAGFAEKGNFRDVPYRTASSPEIFINFLEQAIPLSRSRYYNWAIVTGMGIRWTRYHLKDNHYFEEINDYTYVLQESGNINFTKSKLGITTLNIPLLLEWQTNNSKFFISAGAVCSFKTASSSRIYYKDERGKKQKEKIDSGMTLRPVTMDILAQIGSGNIGVFCRYSPISIFEKGKGPELYPLTLGAMYHF